eukprot:Nitzschia sp. Nitz4//scaffold235_size30605//1877//2881//NITZ4_007970-RA/size30605-augustus-gene-0.16-mRNA-1//-1//CDS//3329543438//5849//frame0
MAENEYDDAYVEEEPVCKVYDKNDFFTILVQMLLAVFALLSLWFKRMNESPRRTFRTWFLDVFKQGLGACYAHVCNMIIAAEIIDNVRGDNQLDDQCAWYGMCYLVDTTLGLILAIWGLKLLDMLAHHNDWVSLKHSGVYEGVDGILHWFNQVLAWMFIMTIVKVIIYFVMVLGSSPLAYVGAIIFAPLQTNIRIELLFVMIFFPGFLNVIYFWVADSYLQAKGEHAGAHEVDPDKVEATTQKKESLLTGQEQQQQQATVDTALLHKTQATIV